MSYPLYRMTILLSNRRIDAQTMKLHHDMHHGAYVKNLNAALEKYPNLQSKSAED